MALRSGVESHSGVLVVGSANQDLVFGTERIPRPGETLLAASTARYAGGKGLNQAVASARAGAQTRLIAALGRDDAGEHLFATMADAEVDTALVRRVDEPTGQAFIVVSSGGENTIIVASGANATLDAMTEADRAAAAASEVLLMQLELPLDIVVEAASVAHDAGASVVLNAAPAMDLPHRLLAELDYLIVNEHEACELGRSSDVRVASHALASRVPRVIVTLGPAGSVLYDGGREIAAVAAFPASAVDTTGAGDTFCGAFAAAVAEGQRFPEAARFATAAAALSVQSVGAVPSIPMRSAIEQQLAVGSQGDPVE